MWRLSSSPMVSGLISSSISDDSAKSDTILITGDPSKKSAHTNPWAWNRIASSGSRAGDCPSREIVDKPSRLPETHPPSQPRPAITIDEPPKGLGMRASISDASIRSCIRAMRKPINVRTAKM